MSHRKLIPRQARDDGLFIVLQRLHQDGRGVPGEVGLLADVQRRLERYGLVLIFRRLILRQAQDDGLFIVGCPYPHLLMT